MQQAADDWTCPDYAFGGKDNYAGGPDFYDIDEEIKKRYEMTLQEFIDTYCNLYTRDKMRGELIGEILQRDGDKIVTVTPMYHSRFFSKHLKNGMAIGVELQDTPENIFQINNDPPEIAADRLIEQFNLTDKANES